jgi:hypothetical protein
MLSHNLTAKQALKSTLCIHQQKTRNNTPGSVLLIKRTKSAWVIPYNDITPTTAHCTRSAIPMVRHHLVAQQVLNLFAVPTHVTLLPAFTLACMALPSQLPTTVNFKHFANSVEYPLIGKTISSYKKSMHNPTTAEV